MGDDPRHTHAAVGAGPTAMRRWLRVPDAMELPAWARLRLADPVAGELAARSGRPLGSVVFGVIDLESASPSPRLGRILELGLVVRRGGLVRRRFGASIGVEVPIPPPLDVLVDRDELLAASTEAEALAGLARVLNEERVEVLVAHNAGFDRAVLERAWREHGLEPELPPFLCSLRLARQWVRAPAHGLDTLIAQLDIPRRPRHRALGDAEMTAVLWSELLWRGWLLGVHSLEALRPLATPSRTPQRRRVRVVVD